MVMTRKLPQQMPVRRKTSRSWLMFQERFLHEAPKRNCGLQLKVLLLIANGLVILMRSLEAVRVHLRLRHAVQHLLPFPQRFQ